MGMGGVPGWRLARDERGATAVEYGLLAAMMAALAIGALAMFGDAMTSLYSQYTTAINAVMPGG